MVIGNAGGEFGVRGYLSAYDAATGKLAWRFYTVPGNPADGFETPLMRTAAKSWNGKWWELGGGGTVWDGIAYDPHLNLVYFGTGNGSPWNRRYRGAGGGDNLFVAYHCGECRHRRLPRGTTRKCRGRLGITMQPRPLMVADLKIGDRSRRVLMQASKDGFFYVLDAKTGKVISARNFVATTWASALDLKTGAPGDGPAGSL